MKHLKKSEGYIGQNVLNITIGVQNLIIVINRPKVLFIMGIKAWGEKKGEKNGDKQANIVLTITQQS